MNEQIYWVEPTGIREHVFADMRELIPNWEHFFHVTCRDENGRIHIFKSCKTLDAAMHLWATHEPKNSRVISVGSYGI